MRRVARVRRFVIERTWQGAALASRDNVEMQVVLGTNHAEVTWDAPWPDGPFPSQPVGQCWGLWEYPVVELFLASSAGPYVEYEFGPAGHWLALYLSGYRQVDTLLEGVRYRPSRDADRWRGEASVPLPESHQWVAGNAYFITGQGNDRRYAAASSQPDIAPDFHHRDCYLTL